MLASNSRVRQRVCTRGSYRHGASVVRGAASFPHTRELVD